MLEIPILTFRLLVLSWITTKRQLIHDKTAYNTEWKQKYDFIIVGGGTAGCVVAKRLAENHKITVLLLEAGGAQDAIYTDIPANFPLIADKRPDIQWLDRVEPQRYVGSPSGTTMPMGKVLGGSSTHNWMVFNRGNYRDYDNWAQKYGAVGWSFKDVLPFFKKFENNTDPNIMRLNNWHGTNGPVQISSPKYIDQKLLQLKQYFNRLGFKDTDVNGPNQLGTTIGQNLITTEGFRASASNAYIDPNPYPNNLHIVTKALVSKILFKGLTAIGVEFIKNDSPFRVFASKEVIICAGGIRSPQLLMLSGIGPKEELSKFEIPIVSDLPVGKNYQNYLGIWDIRPPLIPSMSLRNLEELYFGDGGPLSEFPYVVTYFSSKSNPDKQWPNFNIISYLNDNEKIYNLLCMNRVTSRGRVRLQSTSPHIQPLNDPNSLSDPQEYSDFIEATKFIFYIQQQPSLASLMAFPTLNGSGCPSCPGLPDFQCDNGIKCFIRRLGGVVIHPSGTCRMGAVNRTDVVLDPYLRVKNVQNLRVCDTSIFPEIPNGNLNAPALMTGEKCAHIIKNCYNI